MSPEADAVRVLVCRLLAHQTCPVPMSWCAGCLSMGPTVRGWKVRCSRLAWNWPRICTLPISPAGGP